MMTDPISDMFAQIKNGYMARKKTVAMPYSKAKERIAVVLKEEGYIRSFDVTDKEPKKQLVMTLTYHGVDRAVQDIKRISKPGRRFYVDKDTIPHVLSGKGTVIISTSSGVVSGRAARKKGIGGEVLCKIW